MKSKRLTAAVLALILAAVPSCRSATSQNDDGGKTNEASGNTETTETTEASAPESADSTNLTSQSDPTILTHVFTETAVSLEDGEIKPPFGADYSFDGGKLSIVGAKKIPTDGEKYYNEYYLTTVDVRTGERENRKLDIDLEEFFPGSTLTADGTLYIINTKTDPVTYESSFELVVYSLDDDSMKVVGGLEDMIPQNPTNPYDYIRSIAADEDGYIYLSNDNSVCVLNPDFTKAFDCTTTSTIRTLSAAPDGEIYAACYGSAYPIDREKQGFGESVKFPENVSVDRTCFGEGYDCYFTNDKGLYGYNFEAESADMVVNWKNSSFSPGVLNGLWVLSPEEVFVEYYEQDTRGYSTFYSILRKADDIDISKMTTVSVAYFNELATKLPQYIVKYNKAHPDVFVKGVDYAVYNTADENGGTTKLISEMLTGIYTPDVICLEYGDFRESKGAFSKILENGLYTDMYEFIENDPDIKKDDIMGIVKNTFEIDGALSVVMPSFWVKTLLVNKSEAGDMTSWNYSNLFDFMERLPEGRPLSKNDRQIFNFYYAFDAYIDYAAKTCDFNNPDCVELIEKYAELDGGSGPNKQADENASPGTYACYGREYRQFDDYQLDEIVIGTRDFVRIGYPSESRSGSTISRGMMYIIPKNSAHPEEAWNFIRSQIVERPEYILLGGNGIRMLRSQNEAYADDMRQYYKIFPINSTGKQYSINGIDSYEKNFGENGMLAANNRAVLYNDEDYHAFLDFIDDAGSPVAEKIPSEVREMIFEELSTYVNSDRTAEKTAEILQSRISIYLSERE